MISKVPRFRFMDDDHPIVKLHKYKVVKECLTCPELFDIGNENLIGDQRCRILYNNITTRHLSKPADLLWVITSCSLPNM